MKTIYMLITFIGALLLSNCASNPKPLPVTPTTIPVPAAQAAADTSSTNRKLDDVKTAIDKVDNASSDLSDKIDEITESSAKVKGLVAEAYINGLKAGGEKAKELVEFVTQIEFKLEESIVIREELTTQLDGSNKAYLLAKNELIEVSKAIAKTTVEVETLRGVVAEANGRIEKSAGDLDELKVDYTKKSYALDIAKGDLLFWRIGFGILVGLLIIYVVLKVKGVGLIGRW